MKVAYSCPICGAIDDAPPFVHEDKWEPLCGGEPWVAGGAEHDIVKMTAHLDGVVSDD